MHRDVDFARLRALPGRRVVNAPAGQRIVRRGDAAGDLYVIVSGQVRLERDGAPLAEVGPAELFGEVALYGAGLHPYDAVAIQSTTLLAIPAESAQSALAQAGKFAQGLAQTLADRAGQLAGAGGTAAPAPPLEWPPTGASSAPTEAAARAATASDEGSLLGDLPLPPWEAARQVEQQKAQVDKSVPRPESFYPKTMKCPVCGKSFQHLQPRDNVVEVSTRDADLYEHHRGINTMHYGIPVCPSCFFASYPDDFNQLLSTEVATVKMALDAVKARVSGTDFTGFRDASQARASFELGILCYGARRPAYRKVAGLYHRLAWLAREAGNAERELAYLKTARAGYQSALDNNQVDDARTELLLTYLVGELSRRLGDTAEATKWASLALGHPQIGHHKMINDLAQDLRAELRRARA